MEASKKFLHSIEKKKEKKKKKGTVKELENVVIRCETKMKSSF